LGPEWVKKRPREGGGPKTFSCAWGREGEEKNMAKRENHSRLNASEEAGRGLSEQETEPGKSGRESFGGKKNNGGKRRIN